MSDIPRAREILQAALQHHEQYNTAPGFLRRYIREALKLMTRKSPAFRVEHDAKPMTNYKRKRARDMRRKGLSLRAIAVALNTNIGRVSEAINGQPH